MRSTKVNARLVRQWLRGQKVMNKITQAERRAWLQQLTVEAARQVFDDLHGNADDWKKFGGNMDALERRRVLEKAQGRCVFLRVARRQGLL
ncbi:MAG: hypothetical protein HY327_08330 [Chloroflexi bacterium]|nr:hypothetical protein [Chloroflexota bacterium]